MAYDPKNDDEDFDDLEDFDADDQDDQDEIDELDDQDLEDLDDLEDVDDDDDSDEDESLPIVSLVQLRSSQRYLEATVLAKLLSEAWDLTLDTDEESEADGFVTGESPVFFVMLNKPKTTVFILHNHDENYFDEPEELADEISNLRFAEVVRNHGSWLSVDLMQPSFNEMPEDEAYQLIGKAIEALADEDTMALFCPQYELFNLWSNDLREVLCSADPIAALDQEHLSPVFQVDSAELEAAVEQAKQRWPEFVEHFSKRKPDNDEPFLVKAAFDVDDESVEHMWVEVFGIEPKYIHGHLLNEPMNSAKLKVGSQVEVPLEKMSDWVCLDADGNLIGNFTDEAINKAAHGEDDEDEFDDDDDLDDDELDDEDLDDKDHPNSDRGV